MPPKPRPHGKKKPRAAVPKAGSSAGRGDNRLLTFLAIGGAALLALIGIGAALALGGGDDDPPGDARATLEAAGCTLSETPALEGVHSITTPDGTSPKWNTDPPTSGPHYQVPAVWGVYDDPVNQAQLVHNLEHGGVAIQYGSDVPAATVQQLKAFAQDNPRGTVVAPHPSLDDQIALGAWVTPDASKPEEGTAYLAKCPAYDEAAFAAFLDAYQFRGPERFPPDTLLPGRT